jgi:hypothetical protein
MTAATAPHHASLTVWERRNLRLLAGFAPVLIAAGVAGLTLPPTWSLMSGAPAYDLFHIGFGLLGVAIAIWRRSAGGAILFNFAFGLADLYQAFAGVTGVFPAAVFGLRPADHVVHLVLGLLLAGVAILAARSRA